MGGSACRFPITARASTASSPTGTARKAAKIRQSRNTISLATREFSEKYQGASRRVSSGGSVYWVSR